MPKPSRAEYAAAIFVGPWWGLDPWSVASWPVANDLNMADRMAVIRATRRGASVGDARLAPAVIAYGAAVRADRRGVLWQLPSMIVGFVLFTLFVHFVGGASLGMALLAGSVWALFVVAGSLVWGRRAAVSNAARAEQRARELLGASGG